MKKTLLKLLVIFLFLYFVLSRYNDGETLLILIRRMQWEFLALAVVLQLIRYALFAYLYKEAFEIFGVSWSFGDIIPLFFAAFAAGIVTPFGQITGQGVFIQKALKDKKSKFSVVAGFFIVTLSDFLALFVFLTMSIVFLVVKNELMGYELVGYAAFIVMIALVFFVLTAGIRNPRFLRKALKYVQKVVNELSVFFSRERLLHKNWFMEKSTTYERVTGSLISQKKQLKYLMFISLAMRVVDIASLSVLFLAFGHLINIVPLIVGYSIGVLFIVVTPSPQGLGFVEFIMPFAFSSLGINFETATISTLAYRGLTVWLPAILGFAAMFYMAHNSQTEVSGRRFGSGNAG